MNADLLASFGVDLNSAVRHDGSVPKVPGRIAHIDADFMAYIIAADTVAELDTGTTRTLAHKYSQVTDFAEYVMNAAGAVDYVLHTTPPGSTKGGRHEQAVQQEYQAQRKGREAPKDLPAIRAYMGTLGKCIAHMDQEADDGMAAAAYSDPVNTIICSADKDLRMVPGLHLDMQSLQVYNVDPKSYGSIYIDDTKSSKKLLGVGPAFFFAQCVMGDGADNIKGLPLAPAEDVMRVKPTASYLKDLDRLNAAKTQVARDLAQDRIRSHLVQPKACGPVLTYELLKDVQSIRDAFHLVKALYVNLEKNHNYQFVHWRTGEPVSPTQALLGDMYLLWMRRNKNQQDVVHWLKENV